MSWRILPAIGIPGTPIAAMFRLDEDRTSSTPRGERAAEAVRGYRKGRFLPYRGAGRLGPATLFASGDSQTAARWSPAPSARCPRPRGDRRPAHHLLMIERVRSRVHEFDVLHFHVEHVHLPLFRPYAHKCVTTLHGRLDLPDLVPLYREFHEMPLVSVSNAQRRPLAGANWVGPCTTVCPTPCAPTTPRRADSTSPSSAASPPRRESSTRSRSRAAPVCCASPRRSIEWTNSIGAAWRRSCPFR